MRRLFSYGLMVAALAATIMTPVTAVEANPNTHTLSEIAAANGLDVKQFTQCVKDKKYAEKIATDEAEGYKLGAQGTPYSIVLGPRGEKIAIAGAYPLAAWQDLFESLLGISPTPKPGDGTLPTATNVSSTIVLIDTVKEGVWGNPTGTLSLIIYTDFDCPFCKRLHETMLDLSKKFPNDLRWVNRNLPLDVLHPNARLKANAVECAQEQTKYFGFVNDVFIYQDTTDVSEFGSPEVKPNLPDTYYVRDIYNATDDPNEAKDQELVQIHGNGDNDTHTVIIASLRKLFPELKKYNLSLIDFANPKVEKGTNYVIFRAKQDNSEKQAQERFYRFDIKKQQLKAMKINKFYQGGKGPVVKLSPLEDRFLWMPVGKNGSARKLYVFDLLTDTRHLIASLPASQSFDASDTQVPEYANEIEWLDNNTVGYTVFSQSKKAKVGPDDTEWREKLLVRESIRKLKPVRW